MWFSGFFIFILSLIVEVYLWWKLQASLIFLSGRTCTIGGWLNTFLPHYKCPALYNKIGFFNVAQNTSSKIFHKNTFVNNKTKYLDHFWLSNVNSYDISWTNAIVLSALQVSVCLARASWVWRRAPCLICWLGPSPGTSSVWRVESRLYACSCGWTTRWTWRSSWTWSGWKRKVISLL